uniref:Uncharacterized protein n=1 Tax=Nicotiana tabacum TaxID=4097 RepID=A0A1S3WXJ5_TOBAC|nr:PREDICTED: uncharacterized protein LOC107758991 [Nicotiana tabacum]
MYISIVYAKFTINEREELWDEMRNFVVSGAVPWAVCGDFNTSTTEEEKKGGNHFNIRERYIGNNFTWCNNDKKKYNKIWKRLDRLLINNEWEELFSTSNGFKDIVKQTWNTHIEGSACWKVQQKLKAVSKALSQWSKAVIENIFNMAKNMESKIDEKEQKLQIDDNDTDRIEINKLKAEYIIHMKKVNSFWR